MAHDSFLLMLEGEISLDAVGRAIEAIRQRDVALMRPTPEERAVRWLKFTECLPATLAIEMLERRLMEPESTRQVLEEPMRVVVT